MKIFIIGFEEKFLDLLHSQLTKLNHDVSRINLYISHETNDFSREGLNLRWLEIRNFHDLTIEIIDFEPDKIMYLPIPTKIGDNLNYIEISEIIHVELVEHILETSQMIGSKFYYFKSQKEEYSLVDKTQDLIDSDVFVRFVDSLN